MAIDSKPGSTRPAPATSGASVKQGRGAGPAIMVACLLVAVAAVLFVPMLFGSATSGASTSAVSAVEREVRSTTGYNSVDEAAEELGYMPPVPTALPEGTTVKSIEVQDGSVLEVVYNLGGTEVAYRTAKGADDLSEGYDAYGYSSIETVDGIARSYAGAGSDEFSVAVWAAEGNTYALVASAGVQADDLRLMAESIK